MVDMFELFGEVVKVAGGEIRLVIAMSKVLDNLRDKLVGQVNIFEADYQEIREQHLDIQDCNEQEWERWLFVSEGKLEILIGTEFLAHAYAIKTHNWKGGGLPVLCKSMAELKSPQPSVFLVNWLKDQCGKESQKIS